MIKVSVFYPQGGGSTLFDMNYYLNKHLPMVQQKLGKACKSITVEQGLTGATPDALPSFLVITQMTFDTMQAFQAAFAPHAAAIAADTINYTKIVPILQVSEVRK
ncbi:MAG TPA: EthD family reductase [Stellaceae bacterium]